MPRNAVPDRWMEYSSVGERIGGTQFIAFKVPLKEGICRKLPCEMRFTPRMLIEKIPALGLIIDLTNTNRYYDPQEFQDSRVQYKKIFCPGHVIPTDAVTDQFFGAVDDFLESNPDINSLIGVHCTHGLNRTGYLICKYMIKKLGFAPEAAISAFEKARGYPMERDLYLQDLRDLDGCADVKSGIVCESLHVPSRPNSTSDRPRAYESHSSRSWCPTSEHCGYRASSSRDPPACEFYDDMSCSWNTPSAHPNVEMRSPCGRKGHFDDVRHHSVYRQNVNTFQRGRRYDRNQEIGPCSRRQERSFYSDRRREIRRDNSSISRHSDIYSKRYVPY